VSTFHHGVGILLLVLFTARVASAAESGIVKADSSGLSIASVDGS
jgi:hypothetical protein